MRALALRPFIEDPDTDLLVPPVCDVEVVSALRRLALRGTISVEAAREALRNYADMPLLRPDQLPLLQRVLDLRDNFGAFDAVYVALAESHGAALVTADGRLARAAKEHLRLSVIEA